MTVRACYLVCGYINLLGAMRAWYGMYRMPLYVNSINVVCEKRQQDKANRHFSTKNQSAVTLSQHGLVQCEYATSCAAG